VPIDLTEYERGDPFDGDYAEALGAMQSRLERLQQMQAAHRKRMIVVIEGWMGSGKRDALKRLVASWDPCQTLVRCGAADPAREERHWLAPYWEALPTPSSTTVYFRSWYRRAIDERIAGTTGEKEWIRALDEINEFESQQRDHGTLIVKLFFHVTAAFQSARLHERQSDPWLRHLLTEADLKAPEQRRSALPLIEEMFAQTDTRWAPWRVMDANNRQSAHLAAMEAVATAMEKALPKEPPVDQANILNFPLQNRG